MCSIWFGVFVYSFPILTCKQEIKEDDGAVAQKQSAETQSCVPAWKVIIAGIAGIFFRSQGETRRRVRISGDDGPGITCDRPEAAGIDVHRASAQNPQRAFRTSLGLCSAPTALHPLSSPHSPAQQFTLNINNGHNRVGSSKLYALYPLFLSR